MGRGNRCGTAGQPALSSPIEQETDFNEHSIDSRSRRAGAAVAVALAFFAVTDAQSAQPAATKPLPDAEVRARADALLSRMTPEEKAGQLTQYFNFGVPQEAKRVQDEVAAGRAGSLLFVHDPKELDRLQHIAVEKTRLKIPLLFAFDVIHGLRTIMPVPIAVAASWDPKVAEDGQAVARPKRAPPACIGRSRPWSTSRAIRAGAASSKARARIPIWVCHGRCAGSRLSGRLYR